ncbi:SDR family oxidoreductase [Amycolatopsis pigmentata]|uniref:SDR family oxidoreductase n=1 Tax=Amycolatopsis pigmentata TaxID=450801 RepID=A0ABW5FL94_9PSEU
MTPKALRSVLVIGASGFVGRHAVEHLLAENYQVRCVTRRPGKLDDLAARGCEVVRGDMSDADSMDAALDSMDAVFVCVHTVLRQPGSTDAAADFMDIEIQGLKNIVAACRANDVRRLVSITFLGVRPDSPSRWTRGRWDTEQYLLGSGLDVTIFRPGMIVGTGGRGFSALMSQARHPVALVLGDGKQRFQHIAIEDLTYYMVASLEEPRTFGHAFDVGGDEVLTYNEMVDLAAGILGRPRTIKIHIPRWVISSIAPAMERLGRLPRGSLRGFVSGLESDSTGDTSAIRHILRRPPLGFTKAVERVISERSVASS